VVKEIELSGMTKSQVNRNARIALKLAVLGTVSMAVVYLCVISGLFPMSFVQIYLFIMWIAVAFIGIGSVFGLFGFIFPVLVTYMAREIYSGERREQFEKLPLVLFMIRDD
jgi:hypothetical protein